MIARNNDVAVDKKFDDAPGLEPRDIANSVLYVLSTPLHVQVTYKRHNFIVGCV